MQKAMILAAGLGTRLRPYTLVRPKPLLPVLDRPLLLHSLDQLRGAGFDQVVVNAHHLREQLVDLLGNEPGVVVQQEEAILGTGGGLRRAIGHFGHDPVLVVNGDIFHTLDLGAIYEAHRQSGAPVSLVLHDEPRFNMVAVDEADRVTGFGGPKGAARRLAFTGIHVIDPAVLGRIPADAFHHIIDLYRDLIAEGEVVNGLVARGHFWSDIGTPADYLALHGALLHGRVNGVPLPADAPFLVGAGAVVGRGVRFSDWVAVGSTAAIGAGARLERVVVWDGATVPANARLHDTIVM